MTLPRTLLIVCLFPFSARAATATLRPSKDTTIYANTTLSDGAGSYLFAGSNGSNGGTRVLRSLIAFDLSGQVPAGATINAVTLRLAINTPIARNANTVDLHRLTADWGEGTSSATSGEGGGAAATTNDATWTHRFFNTQTWTTPGGDFAGTVSASQPVSGSSGSANFSGAGLVADVQAWVNNPGSNFGWILLARDENGPAVRFASRQGSPQPTLEIDYTVASSNNTAPAFTTQPTSQSVSAGGSVTFTAAASGTPAPAYQWRKDGAAIAGATSSTLTLSGVTTGNNGTYTVVATNAAGTVTSNPATLTVNPDAPTGGAVTARLSNLSVRTAMSAGQTLIVGFSVSGGDRALLLRGVGPTLGSFGVTGTMADPRIELYNGTSLVTQNDDWGNSTTISAAAVSVGAFALQAGSRDAALMQTVNGAHTVQLKGTGAGVVLVELYDTGTGLSPRLINVSARNQVGTGDNILIFGFVIDGSGTKRVLIRAIGPALAGFGITGALADPRFEVFRSGSDTAVASNDNWDASLASTFTSVGAFALTAGSRDAAAVTPLTPGAYTVQVSGVNNTTGEALVEIYEVP